MFDSVASLRERLPASRLLVLPVLVSTFVVASWAWLAASIFVPVLAVFAAVALCAGLIGSWLACASEAAAEVRGASDNLMTQLGIDGRGNRRLAIYDSASGLYNRWYLELRLQEEFLRCKRYGVSMAVIVTRLGSVALADLSLDSWGGLASALAHTMAQSVRAVDITAALAPMEFAICLVHCDRAGAEAAIQRVLVQLKGHPAQVGLAVYPEDQCDGKALIELARGRATPIEAHHPAAA